MSVKWCGRCRADREIEWSRDSGFGPRAESARCPACATVWGVRAWRAGPFERAISLRASEAEGGYGRQDAS